MKALVTLGVAAFGLFPAIGAAQSFKDLRLSVTPEKTRIVPGEPIVLRIEVKNPTGQSITAHHDLTPRYGMLDVSIGLKGRRAGRYMGLGWGAVGAKPKPAPIEAGKALVDETRLVYQVAMYGREDLLAEPTILVEPGDYQIAVTWSQIGFGEHLSAKAEVTVLNPTGADLAVWNAMRSDPATGAFLSANRGSIAVASEVEKWVANYPDAIQVPHLALALGKHHLAMKAPEKAIAFLEKARTAASKSALHRVATLALADAYGRTRAFDKAKELLTAAVKDFEGSPHWEKFDQMRKELIKGGGSG